MGLYKLSNLSEFQACHLENGGLWTLSDRGVVRVTFYHINTYPERHRCSITVGCSYESHSFPIQESVPGSGEESHTSFRAS